MELKKPEKWVLAVTALFLVLTLGYHLGRSRVPAEFSVQTVQESAGSRERSAAEATETEPAEMPAVNLNTAGREELCALDGIGETLAERIIAYREENGGFASVEDITKVSGIGSGTLERLRGRITVD